jgi:hypothetical protein
MAIKESIVMKDSEVKSNVESLELYSDHYPFSLALRIKNFENESEYKKFIRNCEKLVRSSVEYRQWKNYIIDVLGVNTCMVTHERIDEVTIEVHHHLPSLFVLIQTLINKKIEMTEEFSSFDIAQEAIELHFKNKIGYVTLVKTIHEKFHNGYLTVPKDIVRGDYDYFLREYSSFIDDEALEVITQRLSIDTSNCTWSRNDYLVAGVAN